jgi:hypothetical protein
MADAPLQLWPPAQAPPSDLVNWTVARCRLPDFLFAGPSALGVGDPVLVCLVADQDDEGQGGDAEAFLCRVSLSEPTMPVTFFIFKKEV